MGRKRKGSGARLHPDLIPLIQHYVLDKGWTNAAGLHRQLMDDLRESPLGDEVPEDPRSIRTWVRRFQSQDSSGTWTLANAEDTDPVAVLSVVAAMVGDPDQQSTVVTNGEARVITSLYRVDPAIPPLDALYLARRYVWRDEQDQPTDGLDRYVALRGWTLPPQQHEELRARGLIDGVNKVYLTGTSTGGSTAGAELGFSGQLTYRVNRGSGTKQEESE